MAKVTFWQPTDMAALPVSQPILGAVLGTEIHEVHVAGGTPYFSLFGNAFVYDPGSLSLNGGTIGAAFIDTADRDHTPNIQITLPDGVMVDPALGGNLDDGDFLAAIAMLLQKHDTIRGSDGDDGIRGFEGNDKISGREGNDTLTGDEGKDKFIFDTKLNAATNVDFITDFEVNQDTIRLDRDIFKKIGDKLTAKEFRAGTKAKDGNDRIIYDDETGTLYHDKNGDKAGKKTAFAFLSTNLALDHKDFDMFG